MSTASKTNGCIAAPATATVARTCAALAAAVLGAASLGVINAGSAGAACADWKMAPELVLNLSNGQTAIFQTSGNRVEAGTLLVPGNTRYSGNTSGRPMSGSNIDFGVSWRRVAGNFGGENGAFSVARFTGTVGDDGTARGQALDNENARVDWVSRDRFTCAVAPTPPPQQAPPPPPQQAPPQAPAALTATVTGDVDVYDAPGGGGNIIGILRQGEVVKVIRACPSNDWCALADGRFAWGEFFKNN
ncbi:hypothetical protein [Mycobacterium deserti]|uniref:SH3b domain-containing protein n=1 Tax=Mycobacterium deserti TaxID=2978347 RepID=A0ABT2M9S7_9MYCO|nr:hypothetical protein [Mycobacterium deserti]MCT7658691.1 hypothetical protein [Mycobacterium deserti]